MKAAVANKKIEKTVSGYCKKPGRPIDRCWLNLEGSNYKPKKRQNAKLKHNLRPRLAMASKTDDDFCGHVKTAFDHAYCGMANENTNHMISKDN